MKLRERLQGIVPIDRLPKLRDRYHIIGDIAILALPEELGDYKKVIAQSVLVQDKSIRLVLNKISKLESERRVAGFEILAGSGDTITEHREYGFSYRLDVARVFFNSHLGYERMRVARQVEPGEQVLVPFAGVGPFAVAPAARGARVIALEKSREACSWLTVNARQNQVSKNIAIINADAFTIAQMLKQNFDRAIVPTPYGMDSILEIVMRKVKKRGRIHFYTFKKHEQIEGLQNSYEEMGLEVELFRRCGNVAPGVSRWAFDMTKS